MVTNIRPFRLVMGDDGLVRMRPDSNPASRPSAPVEGSVTAPQLDTLRQKVLTIYPDLPPVSFSSADLKERNEWTFRWVLGVIVHRAIISKVQLDDCWEDDYWEAVDTHVLPYIAASYDHDQLVGFDELAYEMSQWVDQFGPSSDTAIRQVLWTRWAEYELAHQDLAFTPTATVSPRYRSLDNLLQLDRERQLASTGEVSSLLETYGHASWDICAMWRGEATQEDLRNHERKQQRRSALGNAVSSTASGIGAVGSFWLDMRRAKNEGRRQRTLDDLRRARTVDLHRKNSPFNW